jgi:multiple sugar transport system ATP-binding protein
VVALFRDRHELEPGQEVRLRPRADKAHLFDAASGRRL